MFNTSYQVIRQSDGSFHVKLNKPGELPRTAVGFATLAEANAWVARDRRLSAAPDPWVPSAHRRLSGR
jgi:hypothetical protein